MLPHRTDTLQLVFPLSLPLLYGVSVFVKHAGEVVGPAGEVAPQVNQPWGDRAVATRSVFHSHRGFPANAKIDIRELSASLASSGSSSWYIDIML